MKILHIVQNYFPSKGGTQILFKELSERLVKNYGDEVIVCTTDSYYGPEKKFYKKISIKEETINGVVVKRFPFYRFHLPGFRLLNKILVILRLKEPVFLSKYIHGPWSPSMDRYIKNFDGDVICASSHSYKFMHYPLSKNALKPFLFMGAIHFKEDEKPNAVDPQTLKSIKHSSCYIANTSYEKERLVDLGANTDKISVIGCGVDLSDYDISVSPAHFRSKYDLGHGKIIGFVGRHEPFKGIELLIDAMELLWKRGSDLQLIIAGSPTAYTDVIKAKVYSLGNHASKIRFISNFSDSEKSAIYNNLDVFVSVSTEESFGIVYLEAWACKKPVIGANIGAVKTVIDEGINGFLVEPGNVNDLAGKIEFLCNEEKKSSYMGNNGYRKVVNHYTWDMITHKYRELYEEAVKNYGIQPIKL